MSENPFQNHTHVELVDEMNSVSGRDARPTFSELLAGAACDLAEDLRLRMEEVKQLKLRRAGKAGGKLAQDALRRLENPKLKTPYPADRAKALLAERLKLLDEINHKSKELFAPLMRLELVDAEMEAVRESLAEVLALREFHSATGVYARSAGFLSRLYRNHNIDWRDLDALQQEDEEQIAAIIQQRVEPANDRSAL